MQELILLDTMGNHGTGRSLVRGFDNLRSPERAADAEKNAIIHCCVAAGVRSCTSTGRGFTQIY
jgi:hypothetical protein